MPFVVTFDATGQKLASGGLDEQVFLWSVPSGTRTHRLGRHSDGVFAVVFDPKTGVLVSGGNDASIKVWNTTTGKLLFKLDGHNGSVNALDFDPTLRRLASGSLDSNLCLWDLDQRDLLHTLRGHRSSNLTVAIAAGTRMLASGNQDATIRLWDMKSGTLIRELQGHTDMLQSVAFSADGRLLASKACDGTLRLWDPTTGRCLATIDEPTLANNWAPGIAFHPTRPLFAVVGSDSDRAPDQLDRDIHVYESDFDDLFGRVVTPVPLAYITARIVLVGDSGVGKTGLGWRLAHGEFQRHSSTHGQQFWPLRHLDRVRQDGAQCEAILWDLAGQPDYRLIHALFLDDADLALVLFDPTIPDNPLRGVEFWLKQLRGEYGAVRAGQESSVPERTACPVILVAARSDRGEGWLSADELRAFCDFHGVDSLHVTSALTNRGVPELLEQMKLLVPWQDKPATVTNETFKRIRDSVLGIKETVGRDGVILTQVQLRELLESTDPDWRFAEVEMLTAVGHLATHGHVTRLSASTGELRILLVPELLNNLAASLVLEARRNERGLGALEEKQLLTGKYRFPELAHLAATERELLTDSATALFLARNVCFRETDPLTSVPYLIFPGLINLARPELPDEQPLDFGATYSLSGAVENVYASLVVLLGYTNTFTRRNQWRNHAQYVVGDGLICGFRVESDRPGELECVLYFGVDVGAPVRMLFQGLFESFLARQRITVRRYEPVSCSRGHAIDRRVIRERMAAGAASVFCAQCGERIALGRASQMTSLTPLQQEEVEGERQIVEARSRFEGAAFRLKAYVTEQRISPPSCFISYAWGNADHERWVEQLAKDLLQAGIGVVLDRWENARIGASLPRFVERVATCDRVVVVGTPDYRRKYDNDEPMRAFVVAAEGHLIGLRLIGSEDMKTTVLPALLEGSEVSAFPHLLQGRVYADFRNGSTYFDRAIDLILTIYGIGPRHPISVELHESTRTPQGRRHSG